MDKHPSEVETSATVSSSSRPSSIPQKLRLIGNYVKIGREFAKHDPVCHYWCFYYAIQTGLKVFDSSKDDDCDQYIRYLIDQLRDIKAKHPHQEAIFSEEMARAHVRNTAMTQFRSAQAKDRQMGASLSPLDVVRGFYTSGLLIDVLALFGHLDDVTTNARKYAKLRAAYVHDLSTMSASNSGELPAERVVNTHTQRINGDETAHFSASAPVRLVQVGRPSPVVSVAAFPAPGLSYISAPTAAPPEVDDLYVSTSEIKRRMFAAMEKRYPLESQWNRNDEEQQEAPIEVDVLAAQLIADAGLQQMKTLISRAFAFASHRANSLDKNEDYERVRDPRAELNYLQMAYSKKEESLKTNVDKKEKLDKARLAAMERAHKQTNEAALEAIRHGRQGLKRSSSGTGTNLQVFPVARSRSAPSVRIIEKDLVCSMATYGRLKHSFTYHRLLYGFFRKSQ